MACKGITPARSELSVCGIECGPDADSGRSSGRNATSVCPDLQLPIHASRSTDELDFLCDGFDFRPLFVHDGPTRLDHHVGNRPYERRLHGVGFALDRTRVTHPHARFALAVVHDFMDKRRERTGIIVVPALPQVHGVIWASINRLDLPMTAVHTELYPLR